MIAHIPKRPFSLHALVAEAKRRARRRRVLLVLAVIAAGSVGAGAVFATHPLAWLGYSARAVSTPDYRPAFPLRLRPWDDMLAYSPGELMGAAATSHTSAWIVGSVTWRWDGSRWRSVPHTPGVPFSAVAAVAPDDAWAVGDRFVEHWNGANWSVVWTGAGGTTHRPFLELRSVSAAGPRDVWVTGTVFRRDRLPGPLLLHWDGHSWLKVPVPWAHPGEVIDKVVATGRSGVWLIPYPAAGENVEHWDGARWQAVPQPFGPHDFIADFSATGWNDAWAVGSYGTGRGHRSHSLAAHWDGSAWAITPVPAVPGDTEAALNHVVAVGPNDVWGFGSSGHLGTSRGLAIHWDGSRWSVTSGSDLAKVVWPRGIAAAPDGSAWAMATCGGDNVVLRWDGASWTAVPHPPDIQWPGASAAQVRTALRSCG